MIPARNLASWECFYDSSVKSDNRVFQVQFNHCEILQEIRFDCLYEIYCWFGASSYRLAFLLV